MNVMLEFCVIPACLAKSNDSPYCSGNDLKVSACIPLILVQVS